MFTHSHPSCTLIYIVSAKSIFLHYSFTKESYVYMFSFLHFVNEMLVGSLTSVDWCGAGVERGAAWRCELRACVTSPRCQSLRCRVRVRACERAALCEYRRVSLCHLLLHLHNQYAIFITLQKLKKKEFIYVFESIKIFNKCYLYSYRF